MRALRFVVPDRSFLFTLLSLFVARSARLLLAVDDVEQLPMRGTADRAVVGFVQFFPSRFVSQVRHGAHSRGAAVHVPRETTHESPRQLGLRGASR